MTNQPNKAPEPTTFAVTSRAIVRFTEGKIRTTQRLLHEPRQRRSWLIFDVGQRSTLMTASGRRYSEVKIDLREIIDWSSFHAVFKRAMGFPDFYGANMDAWIDCMTSVDAPDEGMSAIHTPPNGVLVLALESVSDFKKRCPEIFDALVGSAAFVNWRRLEMGDSPVLSLSYHE